MDRKLYFHDPDGAREQWMQQLQAMSSEDLRNLIRDIQNEVSDLDLSTKAGAREGAARIVPDVHLWKHAIAKNILEDRENS